MREKTEGAMNLQWYYDSDAGVIGASGETLFRRKWAQSAVQAEETGHSERPEDSERSMVLQEKRSGH